ncbi:MAG: SAM-dependent chlorinase/fluorinase [Trueperaceae bacterium]|nr:MAG: SAM-dependent chlorinase/fluorinase [Trueperaceae bacterium]
MSFQKIQASQQTQETSPGIVALMTDFGIEDTYVGVMKAVILGIAPSTQLVDLTHGIPPQDIRAGAFALLTSFHYFPYGTVFCCVIDPGVGTVRRPIAVEVATREVGPYYLVCPDNGLMGPLLEHVPANSSVVLDNPTYQLPRPSNTFHGRDLFAPVAAYLSSGLSLTDVGTEISPTSLAHLDWPKPYLRNGIWHGSVVYIDHFGNLLTNIPARLITPPRLDWIVTVEGLEIRGISTTFAQVDSREPVAYIGSSGFLELAVRNGSAKEAWGVEVDQKITATEPTNQRR